MSCLRYDAKRDDAEPEVIKGLIEEAGADGVSIDPLPGGKGRPDLLVGFLGRNHLLEVKTNRAKRNGKQETYACGWFGEKPVLARTKAQARKWIRTWRDRRPTLGTVLRAERDAVGGGPDAAAEESIDGCACDACHCGGKDLSAGGA